ncbi:hypothetical protein IJS77_05760, partial [bacterium]|nr:hypothetical protein [bacterium]
SAFIEKGNAFLNKALSNQNPELNAIYLNKAQYFFYVASQNNPPSSEAFIGLGRVYILKDKQDEAKDAMFRAYSIDTYSANANFYLAQYYFNYNDFISALKYYENAKNLGYKNTSENDKMIEICKSKLGDTDN